MAGDIDLCSALVPLTVVLLIGHHVVGNRDELRAWGKRFSGLGFLLVAALSGRNVVSPADWIPVLVSSAIAAAFILGLTWTTLGLAVEVWNWTIGAPLRAVKRMVLGRVDRHRRQKLDAARKDQQRREESARRTADARDQEAKRSLALQQADEQQRRTQARFESQMLFDRHRAEISERLPPEVVQRYFERFLGDDQPADQVEQRALQLRSMIESCVRHAGATEPRAFDSPEDLAEFFQDQKQRVADLPYDEATRDVLVDEIEKQEVAALNKFLRETMR